MSQTEPTWLSWLSGERWSVYRGKNQDPGLQIIKIQACPICFTHSFGGIFEQDRFEARRYEICIARNEYFKENVLGSSKAQGTEPN